MPKLSDFDHGRHMDKKSRKKAEKIPGMADWIKAREKKNLYKEAFVGGEVGAGRTLGAESHNKNRPQFKDDPYRTTKTVANVELANHGLNLATDVGAAGLAAAGGFKPLISAVRKHGLKGIKEIGRDPVFREDIGKMLKAQKYILPVGAGITAAYVGKALYDDTKHKQMRDQIQTEGPEMSHWQMNKAASLQEIIEKLAKTSKKERAAYAAGAVGVGASAKDRILGQKTVYHGTSKENWNKIKNEGFRADKGGIGGASDAVGSERFKKQSTGKIHVTGIKANAKAFGTYSGLGKRHELEHEKRVSSHWDKKDEHSWTTKKGVDPEEAKRVFSESEKLKKKNYAKDFAKSMFIKNEGKVIKAKIPFAEYKKMKPDPDMMPDPLTKKFFANHIAATTTKDIPVEAIKGSKAKFLDRAKYVGKNLPGYIKSHPGRFGKGLALAGGSAYLAHKALSKKASDHSHDKELATFVRVILGDKRPDSKYDQKELKMGIKVEHEHTKSSFIAKKIAKDHLDEIPDYYTRLKFLEELAKKQMGKKG